MNWWALLAVLCFGFATSHLLAIWTRHRVAQDQQRTLQIEANLPPLHQDIDDQINAELQKKEQS